MKFKRLLSLLTTSTLFLTGLYAQTTVLSLTSSGTSAASQTWTNIYCQPVTVRITVKGGGGGGGMDVYPYSNPPSINIEKGSTGATMIGEFTVPAGHVLRAVAGAAGETAIIPNITYSERAGGGGGAGSGVVNATTSTLLILAAGGTGAHSYQSGIGASAATDGNGSGGSAGTWSTGGGGLNSPGGSDDNNGCPVPGGGQVSLTMISQGAEYCYFYYFSGKGGDGMGGGGGASNLGGGGGGHTGGGGGDERSAAKSYNTGSNQVNTDGLSDADPNAGTVLIQLLTDVSNIPPDVTPPTVTCKNHTAVLSAANTVRVLISDVHQSSSDACGPVTLVFVSPNSFNCTHVGPNTVTLTVRDASGNTATCTATVTVEDNTLPQITCKSISITLGANNSASIVPTDVFESGTDNCGTVTPTSVSPNTFDCSDVGPNTIFFQASDGNGNYSNCSSTVTVRDATPPTVTCKNHTVSLSATGTASIAPTDVFQSGTDNCGTVTPISVSPNTFDCSDVGPNTIFFQASDGNGNYSNCSSTVTVRDATPPTATCKNHTVYLSAEGTASIAPTDVFQSGSDNCGTVTPASVSPNPLTCANIGPNTVTLTVNDGHGNTATCAATVTVQDNIPLQVVCKNATTQLNQSGTASIATGDVFQSSTDNCGTVNQQSVVPSSFICANLGANTVTLTVNDGHGNTASCTATVTVEDNVAPSVVCKPYTAYLNSAGMTSVATADVFQSGADNCGTVNQQSVSPSAFVCNNLGANTVTLTVNDGHSNTQTCTATVTVEDNVKPTVVCKNATVYLNTAGTTGITTAHVFQSGSDNCGTVNQQSVSPNTFDCNDLDANTVTLTVNDGHGNTQICTATVTVVDDIPPVIVCPSPIARNTDPNQCSAVVNYTVTGSDNCTYTLIQTNGFASGLAFPTGTNMVNWKVTDAAGHTAICSFTITVTDNQNTSITCPANISKNTDLNQCSAVVTYASPSFSDNCTGAYLTRTSGQASGTAFASGTHLVNWKATDLTGNSAVCNFTVTVSDAQAPAITCPANIVKNTDAGLCTAVVTYANPIYSDNCTGGGAAIVPPSLTSGSQFPIGMTHVVWQATDGAGLTKRCTLTVTVNDAQAPTITCPSNQTKAADAGLCTAIVNYTTPTFSDNCAGAGVAIQSGMLSGLAFPKGQTTVVWRATDAVGLTKTCSFRVTVNDTQTPIFTLCPSSQSVNTDAGSCTAAVTYATPTASDNCTPPPTVVKQSGLASGSNFPKGSSTVVWKATDGVGLTKTCSFTVTVTDAQLPTITCPNNIAVPGSGPSCNATVTYANPTATDNCAITSNYLLSGLASGTQFSQGVTTNIWKATDNSGLTATCAFTVTVNCGTGSQEFEDRGSRFEIPDTAQDSETGQTSNFKFSNFKLSPNPASDRTVIEVVGLPPHAAPAELTVYDSQGRLMWHEQMVDEQTVIELDDRWLSGVYFVTLRSMGQALTKRLVVSRL